MADIERDISREDAHKRAIEDYSQFSQYARNSAQFAFAANGGAAAAILSFMTSIANSATHNPSIDTHLIVRSFATASSFYLLGVFLAVVGMFLLYLSKMNWGHFWEDTAHTGRIDFNSRYARTGDAFGFWAAVTMVLSALAFLPGSFFAVAGFFRQ